MSSLSLDRIADESLAVVYAVFGNRNILISY